MPDVASHVVLSDLQAVFGTRLEALVAYAPDSSPQPSVAIVSSLSFDDLSACAARSKRWHRAGLATPVVLTRSEFGRSLDAFPVEFGEIIARHRGDDDVLQLHSPRGFGDALRLVHFEREGFGRTYRAKTTGARAAIPRNHERRRALAPAFPVVRTLRALADRVQLQFVQQRARSGEGIRRRQVNAQPFGQARARFGFGCRHVLRLALKR